MLWLGSLQSFVLGMETNNTMYISRATQQINQAQALYDQASAEMQTIQPG